MKRVPEEQIAKVRTIDTFGVLMADWGIKYTPPVKRMWPGKIMCWTHITQCPVCAMNSGSKASAGRGGAQPVEAAAATP